MSNDITELPANLHQLPRTLLGFHVQLASRPTERDASLEARVARIEARHEIQRVLNLYAYAYDAGDIERMMTIYSADCVLVNGGGTFEGLDAIRSNYEQAILERGLAFHHLSDPEIAIDDEIESAWATGYLHNLAVRDGNPGGTMASCVFHLRSIDGAWKVVECRIAVSEQHSFGPPYPRKHVPSVLRPTGAETTADLLDDVSIIKKGTARS
ncbi:MAG TPA: nuclear transport factor 2 family protein [Galbitalea sp.]